MSIIKILNIKCIIKYCLIILLTSSSWLNSYAQLVEVSDTIKNTSVSPIIDNNSASVSHENLSNDTLNKNRKFYENLKTKAYKTRVTKELYRLLFVSQNKDKNVKYKKREESALAFVPFQGKRINKIIIDAIPPFQPDFLDSLKKTQIWIEKTANKLHNTSSRGHIKRLLYTKEGDILDAFNTAEDERLIRSLPYIKDAKFIIAPVMGAKDLVDLYLLVKDKFSWGVDLDIGSITSPSMEVYNQNLYGRGHEIKSGIEYNSTKDQKWGYAISYEIPNIGHSHINAGITVNDNYKKSLIELYANKKFQTYMTKYAGGLTLSKTLHSTKINPNDPVLNEEPLDFKYSLSWVGRSFKFKAEQKGGKSQLFSTFGYSSLEFLDRPKITADSNEFFHNQKLYLTSLTLSKTQYFKSNLIYNFGRTEDIPSGYLIQLTAGLEDREFSYRKYLAFEYQQATNFIKNSSYLFSRFAIGGYFDGSYYEQGNLIIQNKYISQLRKSGRYRFRNFVELNYNLGIRRFPEEFITLNTPTGIRDFKSLEAVGTQRLVLKLEHITFTPFIIGGFKFALFNFIDAGTIGSNQHHPLKNKAYYGAGLGLRLNNENLVFKTIQLSFAIYPKAPSDFSTFQYDISGEDRPRFNNFNVGRPKTIDFE